MHADGLVSGESDSMYNEQVGAQNAGKSSLINAMKRAVRHGKPRNELTTAALPGTTLGEKFLHIFSTSFLPSIAPSRWPFYLFALFWLLIVQVSTKRSAGLVLKYLQYLQ